jgi:hypothetical protein
MTGAKSKPRSDRDDGPLLGPCRLAWAIWTRRDLLGEVPVREMRVTRADGTLGSSLACRGERSPRREGRLDGRSQSISSREMACLAWLAGGGSGEVV